MANTLIVEDEKNMQDIISDYMRRGGHTCFTADDGVDALMILKEKNSNRQIVFHYERHGKREEKRIETSELENGLPFSQGEILSVHSQEPTLEDVFIRYTGRGISG